MEFLQTEQQFVAPMPTALRTGESVMATEACERVSLHSISLERGWQFPVLAIKQMPHGWMEMKAQHLTEL